MLRDGHKIKTLIRISVQCYCTKNEQKKLTSLYSKISPLGNPKANVALELDKWVEMGNNARFAELRRIVIDLRRRKRFCHALQVSEWMRSKGIYTFTPVEHAVQLDLIGKVHGSNSAENYFNCLSEQDRTEKAYGALLHCYVRQNQTEKVFAHLKTMKENGIILSCVAYNDIMCLYFRIGENEKVVDVLNTMKQDAILPDNMSYRLCISSYGVRSDISGMEKMLREMENQSHIVMDWNTYAVVANFYAKASLDIEANAALKKAEERLDNKDLLGYNHLISLHAGLGNREHVFRLWDLKKKTGKRCLNKDYMNIMESMVKLDEIDEAERVLKEWELSGNCYDFRVPNVVIAGLTENGLCQKAEALLDQLTETGKASTSNIWARVAAGYMEKDQMEKALRCIEVALSLGDANKVIKIQDTTINKVLSLLGEKASSDVVEEVVNLLRSAMPLKRQAYHTLLISCIAGCKQVDGLLKIMNADGFEEDEETERILAMKLQTKSGS